MKKYRTSFDLTEETHTLLNNAHKKYNMTYTQILNKMIKYFMDTEKGLLSLEECLVNVEKAKIPELKAAIHDMCQDKEIDDVVFLKKLDEMRKDIQL